MIFSLILFTFNLTLSLVVLVLNRNIPDRLPADRLIAFFVVIFMLDMSFGIGSAAGLSENGIMLLPSLFFGYVYAPFLFFISFTSEEKPIQRKKIIHGVPPFISLLVVLVLLVFSFEEKTLRRIYWMLNAGVILSCMGYFFTRMVLLQRGMKVNFFSNRFLYWFWGVCLVSLAASWIYGLQLQNKFSYLVMMPVWTGILMTGSIIHLYRYYFLRFQNSASGETFTFYFESSILDQIRSDSEEKKRFRVETNHTEIKDISKKIEFRDPDLDLSSFADQMDFTVSFVEKKVKEETGFAFKNFVNMKRISHATDLLEAKPELSIEELMIQSGFRSRATFYRNFKIHAGMTPKEFSTKIQSQKKS